MVKKWLSFVQPGMSGEMAPRIEALAADLAVVFRIISPRHDVCPVPDTLSWSRDTYCDYAVP